MAAEPPAEAASGSVLFVDDDRAFVAVMTQELRRLGFHVKSVTSGEAALEAVKNQEFDVILLDLRLGSRNGLEIFQRIREEGCSAEVIVLTGHGTIQTAIEAMRSGAREYLTKPCKLVELHAHLAKAVAAHRLEDEHAQLKEYTARQEGEGTFVSADPTLSKLLESLPLVARTDVPVLIQGESGTGKELIARRLHASSALRSQAFITVNCAVLKAEMLESELFGHEKGAFTGAIRRKLGLFEIAAGGTLFLDEVGEMEESIQAKLLRVLQFGEFRRVGGTENIRSRVRVIAATNRNLEDEVERGRFRQDLFFRLNVVLLELPPLRSHVGDLEDLFGHFVRIYGGSAERRLTPEALDLLKRYSWPGNVRELENVVRRLLIFSEGAVVDAALIRTVLPRLEEKENEAVMTLEEVERRHLLRVLADQGNDKRKAAEILGISLKTLYNKLHQYNEM